MNRSIGHILAPKEFAEWGACAPKYHLVIKDTVFCQNIENVLMSGRTGNSLYWALVHIVLDSCPVLIVDEFGQIDLAHHGGHHMRVLQMEIVVRTIEVCGHDGNIVGAILQVIALAHLQSGNLRNGVLLIGVFQRRCQQTVFLHRLWRVLGIDAGAAQEEQFLDAVGVCLGNHIALYLHIHHDEVGAIE